MKAFLCSAAIALAAPLAGCGGAALFVEHPLPESAAVDAAPWPRLVDTPTAPPKGTYTAAVPDPAVGVATATDLHQAARDAAARAVELEAPVIDDASARQLGKAE
jgi:hypothetical protein